MIADITIHISEGLAKCIGAGAVLLSLALSVAIVVAICSWASHR